MRRKAIFDAVRRMLGRGFRRHEVAALDAAIDAALEPALRCASDEAAGAPVRTVGARGIALIKRFEGCARKRPDGMIEAYPDPASVLARTGTGSGDPWTIGWGATGRGVARGTVWTQAQCDERLAADVARHAAQVAAAIGDAPTTQAQFDALVSFHFNTGAIGRATLTLRHVSGDHAGAAREFARWNKAGGRVLAGLVRRREAEAALYSMG